MKTINKELSTETLKDFFENEGFQVHLFEQDNKINAEVEMWTNGGVDMLLCLQPFTKESFIEQVNDFDIDEEIDLHRQDPRYKAVFTLTQSLKDFKDYHKHLKQTVKKLNKLV